ncbi:hypothetical protein [Ornithinimicrobium faecis]|uniref:hypothetical protein n=1 Tax=Ornithinimicrobium faecis TaxID=2934158 RepID=UPI002FCBA267
MGSIAFGGWDRVDLALLNALRDAVDRHRRFLSVVNPLSSNALRAAARTYADYYAKIYRAAQQVSDAQLVVDSGKHPTLAAALTHDTSIDLRVLHLIRDSVAVAYSWSKEVHRPESRSGINDLMAQYSGTYSAMLWNLTALETEALALRHTATARMRYEDFVTNPAETLRVTLTRLNLAQFSPQMDRAVTLRAQHTVSGNPVRFERGTLTLRKDDAWRTAMDTQERRKVALLSSPLRKVYGY